MKTAKELIKGDKLKAGETVYHGCASVSLDDGTRIDVHMANNTGRGSDNVTLTRVTHDTKRPKYTRGYALECIIGQTRVSGWKGKWVLSGSAKNELNMTN